MPRAAQDIGPRPILTHLRSCSQTRLDLVENALRDHSDGAAHAQAHRNGCACQTAPLGERVCLTALHEERSCIGLVWQMASLAGHGRRGHVWEMAPVVGCGCADLAMISLERRSRVELQGIWPSLGPWRPHPSLMSTVAYGESAGN